MKGTLEDDMDPLRVGIVGIGNISGIYLKNLSGYRSTTVVAVADISRERAEKAASEYSVPNVLTPEELLAHPDVDLVLNLTIPAVHGEIAMKAVSNGKHVYNEKPLTIELDEAHALVKTAKDKGVRVGCAPDTFLGAGIQTAIKVIDSGKIGDVVAGQAFMMGHGPEAWHPSPEFFYKRGGGPMLDMGPYYITALVALFGGVVRTTGMTRASFPTRTVGSGDLKGSIITVETPTHLAGVMEMQGGAIVELTTSFDVYHSSHDWKNPITIYGSEGTMRVPDPNSFGGPVLVRRHDEEEWTEMPLEHGFAENSRGLGVLDIAYAIQENRPQRVTGDLALHVLDTMLSFEKSSNSGTHQVLTTTVSRPEAMAIDQYKDEVPTPVAE